MPIGSALLLCTVIGIADGDTLTARCDAMGDVPAQTITVRLAEVDAPEKAQPFGNRSRQHLATLCFRQRAEVRPLSADGGRDRYGRTVAHVRCNGTDANAEQVRAGMAWAFPRYVTDGWLYWQQDEARAAQRGLWADARPVAPWEWRGAPERTDGRRGAQQ
jgi:endonuclease YncB( thermonuclease family)